MPAHRLIEATQVFRAVVKKISGGSIENETKHFSHYYSTWLKSLAEVGMCYIPYVGYLVLVPTPARKTKIIANDGTVHYEKLSRDKLVFFPDKSFQRDVDADEKKVYRNTETYQYRLRKENKKKGLLYNNEEEVYVKGKARSEIASEEFIEHLVKLRADYEQSVAEYYKEIGRWSHENAKKRQ